MKLIKYEVAHRINVQQEIDANYANVSQLAEVSMETKVQRLFIILVHTIALV